MSQETAIVIFKEKGIRRTWHNDQWWFVIVDVIAALTDSVDPTGYLKDMRRRDQELNKGWGQIATPPFSRNYRRKAKDKLCQYGRNLAYHSIYSFS